MPSNAVRFGIVSIYLSIYNYIYLIKMFASRHPTDPKNYLEYTVGGSECPFSFFYENELNICYLCLNAFSFFISCRKISLRDTHIFL